ncbi:endonuclease/exonuclease/phosphatase family protein [soil metagenome]
MPRFPIQSLARAIRPQLVPIALVLVTLVHPLATLLAQLDWKADLLSHFQGPAFVVTILGAVLLVWWRRRWPALALMALALSQFPPLWQFQAANPVPPDPDAPQRLLVLVSNVHSRNQNHEALERLIRAEQPDVVGLVEFNQNWQAGLARVAREYPYRVEFPYGTQGVALWLKQPPPSDREPPELVFIGSSGYPALSVATSFAGQPLDLWLVHPPNPLDPRGRTQGPTELLSLARAIHRTEGARLILGDLNRTEGSPYFRSFLQATGTRDSRLGFGRQPSWPTWSPLYRIAIDHVFPGPELAVRDRRLGPNIGSDHFPVIVELAPSAWRGSGSARNALTQSAQGSGW